jgi:hypothetical protein
MIIIPSIGRVVWYWHNGTAQQDRGEQPFAALVTYVHSDICVNLVVFDPNGNPASKTSVRLAQEGDKDLGGPFASWMPYQLGQAKAQAAS